MALVANGVVRFTLNGTFGGSFTWANVWDVWMGGVADPDRADRCNTYAGALIDAWKQTLSGNLSGAVELTDVSWVDLDSIDGSTGSRTTGLTEVGPFTGTKNGPVSSSNVAILVTKQTTSARGARNGRMYLVGLIEDDTDGNNLTTSYHNGLDVALELFLGDLTDPASIPEEGINPCVVHTRNTGTPEAPVIVYNGMSYITNLAPQLRLATQRRRLRR